MINYFHYSGLIIPFRNVSYVKIEKNKFVAYLKNGSKESVSHCQFDNYEIWLKNNLHNEYKPKPLEWTLCDEENHWKSENTRFKFDISLVPYNDDVDVIVTLKMMILNDYQESCIVYTGNIDEAKAFCQEYCYNILEELNGA